MDILKHKLLPYKMGNLAKVISLSALLKIVELRGGGQLKIPKRAHAGHWLVEHIGLEDLQKLAEQCGGERISIDRCCRLNKMLKATIVLDEFNGGASNWQLAKKYQVTTRTIINWKNAAIQLREES